MKRILKNMVLQAISSDGEVNYEVIRIIWIDSSNQYAWYVNVEENGSMPEIIETKIFLEMMEGGELKQIKDPYSNSISEDDIPEKHKNIRDERWEIVKDLWNHNEPDILFKNSRGKCIKEGSKKFNVPEIKIRRTIKLFWQRGMTKNALLPDYINCGCSGERKNISEAKRGRPRNKTIEGQQVSGINIDNYNEKIINMAIELYYNKKNGTTAKEVYDKMINRYFSDKKCVNNKIRHIVWDKSRIPTYWQFMYWIKKNENFKKSYIARNGENKYLLKKRPLLDNSMSEVTGPGSKFQIDATIADIYLVSELNRDRLIGRPVIYSVIDVFSRLVVGIYVGLEGPSWIGAMMALDNVVCNKVQFCMEYGIKVLEEDWPCSYLPESILADRGEFEGYNVENLINNLGVTIENTPPSRGDLKGIVERQFRTTNERIKHMAPGAVLKEYRERGERDQRLDATLDLKEITRIIIYLVLERNRGIVSGYPREREMLIDEVPPSPLEIWDWGIRNRKTGLINMDRDIVRLNLMPKATVAITREGIKFKNLYYSCEEAIELQWFISGRKRSIEIVYDPRDLGYIYIPQDRGKSYIKCYLLKKCEGYKGLFLEEVIFQQELENELKENKLNEINQKRIDTLNEVDEIIKDAKEKVINSSYESNRMRIKGIKNNRAEEKKRNRREEKFELGSAGKYCYKSKNSTREGVANYDSFFKEDNLDLLKKVRRIKNGK